MLLLLLFAVTNGYISTLIMVRGVSDPVLKRHEVDVRVRLLAGDEHFADVSKDCTDCCDVSGILSNFWARLGLVRIFRSARYAALLSR